MKKQTIEQPKKKRQSGRHKTKAQVAAMEAAKNSTQEEPKRTMEELLNGTAVMGVVQDGRLVKDPSLIDMSKATIIIDRNHGDAEMAAESFRLAGANVILDEAPKFDNPVVTEAATPDVDPNLHESLPKVDYIYPFDPLMDPENPLFASVLLAERQDARIQQVQYSDAERARMLEADMEYARRFTPDPEYKYAGMSQTERYEARAVEFIKNTNRRTRTRLSKAQQNELVEIYNFLFSLNEKPGSCDLCFIRIYSKVEKYLYKKKLI